MSVNTDDLSLLRTSLRREYGIARVAYGWSDEIVREVARTSIEASFAPAERKAEMAARLAGWA